MSANKERKASHRLPQQFSIGSQLNSPITTLMSETELPHRHARQLPFLFSLQNLACHTSLSAVSVSVTPGLP